MVGAPTNFSLGLAPSLDCSLGSAGRSQTVVVGGRPKNGSLAVPENVGAPTKIPGLGGVASVPFWASCGFALTRQLGASTVNVGAPTFLVCDRVEVAG